jgi:hypothetical protein
MRLSSVAYHLASGPTLLRTIPLLNDLAVR